MKARTQLIQDTRYTKQGDNTFPIRIRITYTTGSRTIQKYFPTGESLTKAEWAKMNSKKPGDLKDKKLDLDAKEQKAAAIIEKMKVFSFDTFKKKYDTGSNEGGSVIKAFEGYIHRLQETEQIGTLNFYVSAKNSLERFRDKKKLFDLKFNDITPEFLEDYERWMLKEGKKVTGKAGKVVYKGASLSTVSMYVRCLRAIFNEAIDNDEIDKSLYPFGRRKYQIRTGKGRKIALTPAEVATLDKYKPEAYSATDKAKDLFFFMYYCDGINPKDLALLKYSNIKDGFLFYVREKTARTKAEQETEPTYLLPEAQTIIKKWGNDANPDNYIFKILQPELKPAEIKKKVRDFNSQFNKQLKKIAKEVGIEKNLTSYVARHTSAITLHKGGLPLELSRRKLRHTDLKTTQAYFATGFNLDEHKQAADILTGFKSKMKAV